ncbi:Undecaprenyl-diphosphatase [Frankliniella fusca]|uniref:Undecaprenyl-diphosphatase n=1 Tax=Frankliniella fusca TaxID=407009 RepID=A0AAE1HBC8_9NEOP|nr:Undecaprenyl-diphosphatase [Frankliniella fusca]
MATNHDHRTQTIRPVIEMDHKTTTMHGARTIYKTKTIGQAGADNIYLAAMLHDKISVNHGKDLDSGAVPAQADSAEVEVSAPRLTLGLQFQCLSSSPGASRSRAGLLLHSLLVPARSRGLSCPVVSAPLSHTCARGPAARDADSGRENANRQQQKQSPCSADRAERPLSDREQRTDRTGCKMAARSAPHTKTANLTARSSVYNAYKADCTPLCTHERTT